MTTELSREQIFEISFDAVHALQAESGSDAYVCHEFARGIAEQLQQEGLTAHVVDGIVKYDFRELSDEITAFVEQIYPELLSDWQKSTKFIGHPALSRVYNPYMPHSVVTLENYVVNHHAMDIGGDEEMTDFVVVSTPAEFSRYADFQKSGTRIEIDGDHYLLVDESVYYQLQRQSTIEEEVISGPEAKKLLEQQKQREAQRDQERRESQGLPRVKKAISNALGRLKD